jgi:hypothetical protein
MQPLLLTAMALVVLAAGPALAQAQEEATAMLIEELPDPQYRGEMDFIPLDEHQTSRPKAQDVNSQMCRHRTGPVYKGPASDLIGKRLANAQGENLGTVRNVMLDQNKRELLVIEIGSFLGTGGKQIPIALDNVELRDGQLVWMSEISKRQLGGVLPNRQERSRAVEPERLRERN